MVGLLTALASLCGVLVAGPVSVAEGRSDRWDDGLSGGWDDGWTDRLAGPGGQRADGGSAATAPNRPRQADPATAQRTRRLNPATPYRPRQANSTSQQGSRRVATAPQRARRAAPATAPQAKRAPAATPKHAPKQAPKHAPKQARAAAPKAKKTAPRPERGAAKAGGAQRRNFHGWAIDRCQAPPVSTIRAWNASPYRGIGVYFGGRGRHCKTQKHLSTGWLREVKGLGWEVIPIYVGSQSPCVTAASKRRFLIGDNAWAQGRQEAQDAVRSAGRLGMVRGSALYLDMEAYHFKRYRCGRTTLAFVRSWNREVRRQGYVPGFYSSANSGVRHMEESRKAGEKDLPEVMWFARWGVRPSLYGEQWLDRRAWHPHRRIHQYAGDVTETHGGRKLAIDRNLVDAPVAIIR
ncbi:DUF1906 domain-containing protein [Streptomyces sp. 796.1]|uniref:DUF1906 domain-containing protein n=1 Tax=Streptomyces sp. 796.1 TaxID=3163029 RepID=UPI0039C988CB